MKMVINFLKQYRRARLVGKLVDIKQQQIVLNDMLVLARAELYSLKGQEAVLLHEIGTL